MKLLAIESYAEDQAIQSAWGTTSECNYKLMLGGYHQQIQQSFNMRINFKLNSFRIKKDVKRNIQNIMLRVKDMKET